MKLLLGLLVSSACFLVIYGQTPTPLTLDEDCALGNKSCSDCVGRGAKCLYCYTNPLKCIPYPAGSVIPHKSLCPLKEARWGVCWVNYEILLIVMGCLAGVILISCGCCIYCCCCKPNAARQRKKYQKEEARLAREKEERSAKHTERRAERQSRMDEIRQKYGLNSNKDSRYQKFQDES